MDELCINGLKWALEIIEGKTGYQDRKVHKEYYERIKKGIEEAIEYHNG